jgi:hypothetical protein
MKHHKIMGVIAGLGLFIACATLKRAVKDEEQCVVPTVEAIQACLTVNPLAACPALAAWYDCLARADSGSHTLTVKLAPVEGGDGGHR